MKLEQGKAYKVKLTSGAWVSAVFLKEETYGGFKPYSSMWPPGTGVARYAPLRQIRKRTRYYFRNLGTGRTITLRSQAKVREIEGGAL